MLQAVRDIVLVEPVYEKQSGLIWIPDQAQKQNSDFYGIVISLGPECPIKDEIKSGDKIIFRRHEGTPIEHEGKKYLALQPKWVEAKMED